MNSSGPGLRAAFALSLALHAGAFALGLWLGAAPRRPAPPPIQARLLPPELPEPPAAPPVLTLPEPEPPVETRRSEPAQKPARRPEAAERGTLDAVARREANRQLAERMLYPPEAVARGIEGEVLVMLFLDEAGNAVAARVEKSSGHALLDDAAIHAARTLRALPGSGAREALLPVRFRLR